MKDFKDISETAIKSIKAPALVINGDLDVVRPEHALELYHTLQAAKLAILPGVHGECLGEICSPNPQSKVPLLTVEMIEEFLKG
jgi:hypothetical protein